MNYYAVKKGHTTGIFTKWAECSKQVHGFKGAMYKKFDSMNEAQEYLNKNEALVSERHETEKDIFDSLNKDVVLAYVDGSNLGDGSAFSWASILFTNNERIELSGKEEKRFTEYRNVAGELFASVKAVHYAIQQKKSKIIIYHDYSGIRHWALGEWKTKNDLSKFYKSFFDKALKVINVEFVKVEGHTGDKFNEQVDLLAKKAVGIK